jgi:UDP-N-acetylglucosamine 2-epimerase (non-hydrolysing)
MLLTTHREENVDHRERLMGILRGIGLTLDEVGMPIVFPVHPRTEKRIQEMHLSSEFKELQNHGLRVIKPLGYFDFLMLQKAARMILTDSGGLQEEACILGKETVTLRDNTERPETLEAGTNTLAGTEPSSILSNVKNMFLERRRKRKHPFGDGKAAERIAQIIMRALKNGVNLNGSPRVKT